MTTILTGRNITKAFSNGQENYVLDGVDIEILKGEFVAVMGPSGCGKTTLLFALSGTDEISGGTVRFGSQDLSALKENQLADLRRTKMGFVFQQPTMLKNLNILDNIILSSVHGNAANTEKACSTAKDLMQQTGIGQLGERSITEVSGGQLQRAGICRALMNQPEILFADEPTGALNSKSAAEIMELLTDINRKGTAIFLVTHDAKVAARADRVLFMKDGKIQSELALCKFTGSDLSFRTEDVLERMKDMDL